MGRAALLLLLGLLAGCMDASPEPEDPSAQPAPCENEVRTKARTLVLGPGEYYLGSPPLPWNMWSGRGHSFDFDGDERRLVHLTVEASWQNESASQPNLFLEVRREDHVPWGKLDGPSPLRLDVALNGTRSGQVDVSISLSQQQPAAVALVDQPVNVTVTQTFRCAV